MLIFLTGCDDNVVVPIEEMGDGLVDKISGIFEDDYYEIEYDYTYDSSSRLSAILYNNNWSEEHLQITIEYPSEFEIHLQSISWTSDYNAFDKIFHHDEKIDSLVSDGGSPFGGYWDSITRFHHAANEIIASRERVSKYDGFIARDTTWWRLNTNGLIASRTYQLFGHEFTEVFEYDSGINPFHNSFIQASPMNSFWFFPILVPNNRTLQTINGRNIDNRASYEYFGNGLPKNLLISGSAPFQFEFAY